MQETEKQCWIDALRSGDYKQTFDRLAETADGLQYYYSRRGPLTHFCVLGVNLQACHNQALDDANTLGKYSILTLTEAQTNFFTSLNDRYKLSFEEMALVIENLPEEEWFNGRRPLI